MEPVRRAREAAGGNQHEHDDVEDDQGGYVEVFVGLRRVGWTGDQWRLEANVTGLFAHHVMRGVRRKRPTSVRSEGSVGKGDYGCNSDDGGDGGGDESGTWTRL